MSSASSTPNNRYCDGALCVSYQCANRQCVVYGGHAWQKNSALNQFSARSGIREFLLQLSWHVQVFAHTHTLIHARTYHKQMQIALSIASCCFACCRATVLINILVDNFSAVGWCNGNQEMAGFEQAQLLVEISYRRKFLFSRDMESV